MLNAYNDFSSGLGRYVCPECGIHTRRSKIEWLGHIKGSHEHKFRYLVFLRLENQTEITVLDQALAAIKDDDHDNEVRLISSTYYS